MCDREEIGVRTPVVIRFGMRTPGVSSAEFESVAAASIARRDDRSRRFARFTRMLRGSDVAETCFRDEAGSHFDLKRTARRLDCDRGSAVRWPNQSPEPTVMLVTPRAGARVAPSTTVAHL
jgi:hypothetical protein